MNKEIDFNIIGDIEKNLSKIKEFYIHKKAQKETIEKLVIANKGNLISLENEKDLFVRTKLLIEKSAEFARDQIISMIESIVTNALKFIIYDRDMRFVVDRGYIKGRANGSVAEFYIAEKTDNGIIKYKPKDAKGGGIVDVVSLALLFSMKECFGLKGLLLLDEPIKHLSREYVGKVSEFLKYINERYGTEIIVVTHNDHLSESADKMFKAKYFKGQTVIESTLRESLLS